jgi:hypothetical protein
LIDIPAFFSVLFTFTPKACSGYRAMVGWVHVASMLHFAQRVQEPAVKDRASV